MYLYICVCVVCAYLFVHCCFNVRNLSNLTSGGGVSPCRPYFRYPDGRYGTVVRHGNEALMKPFWDLVKQLG